MITYHCQKLYRDKFASVRDITVNKARYQGLRIIFNGKTMTLTPQDLEKRLLQITPSSFRSKYDGSIYHLYDFVWEADKEWMLI